MTAVGSVVRCLSPAYPIRPVRCGGRGRRGGRQAGRSSAADSRSRHSGSNRSWTSFVRYRRTIREKDGRGHQGASLAGVRVSRRSPRLSFPSGRRRKSLRTKPLSGRSARIRPKNDRRNRPSVAGVKHVHSYSQAGYQRSPCFGLERSG
jgi:hypothetical protein